MSFLFKKYYLVVQCRKFHQDPQMQTEVVIFNGASKNRDWPAQIWVIDRIGRILRFLEVP